MESCAVLSSSRWDPCCPPCAFLKRISGGGATRPDAAGSRLAQAWRACDAPRSGHGASRVVRSMFPDTPSAPTVGSPAMTSRTSAPLGAMQNVPPRLVCNVVNPTKLGAVPDSVTLCAFINPKAPGDDWPSQNIPSLAARFATALVRFGITTDSTPTKVPALGGQSIDVCAEPSGAHGNPALSPLLHWPPSQRGHGESASKVR